MSEYVPSPHMPAGCVWSNYEHATLKFCEDNLCGLISQPANTWSNIFFIILGLYVMKKNKIRELVLFGPIAIAVGFSSFFYHMSFTSMGQIMDLSSMYLFGALLITMNALRLNYISYERHFLFYLALVTACIAVLVTVKGKIGPVIFAGLVACSLFLEYKISRTAQRAQTDYKNLKIALSIFGLSFFSWILDVTKVVCDPSNHFIQGHALWHVLNAFCFVYLHKFYSQFYVLKKTTPAS